MIKILTKDKSGQLLGIPHPVSHVAYISVKLYENIKRDSKKQTSQTLSLYQNPITTQQNYDFILNFPRNIWVKNKNKMSTFDSPLVACTTMLYL